MKNKSAKSTKTMAAAARGVKIKTSGRAMGPSSWSLSVYVYWFIILFFIAATFYILGRSHTIGNTNMTTDAQVVAVESEPVETPVVQEEKLLSASDYYDLGKQEIIDGNLDAAIKDLTSAIKADAGMLDAYILRGEAYMQNGDYRDAMRDFDNVISRDNGNSIAYYDRSLLNTRLEDFGAAMNDINNALATYAMRPNNVLQLHDLYAKRGQLNLWIKNWDGAIADYTNALDRTDGVLSALAYADRAEAYTAIGNYASAVADYTSAIRVIAEQIQGATTIEQKEDLSMRAMNYFEKSAALNLNVGNTAAANSDLTAAYAIATSIRDVDTAARLRDLLSELHQ